MPAAISDKPITKAQLRSVHVAKARAKLDEEEYRGLLEARFGVDSAKKLTRRQASDLLTSFGRTLPNPPGVRRRVPRAEPLPDNVVVLATARQRAKIADLMAEIDWREEDGYERWLRANQGIDAVRTQAEAQAAIEGLKGLARR